ncbi:basic amino acid/polyamine antiporter [Anaerovorax odorimutans]|uniref:Basic amino acid/polyamine antiporter n=1 Tax=Anaerovorax odorimutans TaxID=109327 RepID=A0ABT1RK99_9FIRM|nr:basic amino acid/polyamine antiporter [Anaerovorax odorimutans]MCQ4635616.1 basic amino acid/polyamine antiporter [Anaerovorax odorimutans]
MKQDLNHGQQLSCFKLTGIAVGSTIASGAFSLSGDMAAAGAGTAAVLTGWLLCGLGMLALVICFYHLSEIRPELTGGIYSYARAGFGDYAGFNSAWGYWISNFLGNVSFATLMFAALGHFFPVFGAGNNLLSIIGASAVTWLSVLLVLRGMKAAAFINLLVTFAKLIPIFLFIMAVIFMKAFDPRIFFANFMGEDTGLPFGSQVMATTYTTAWAFIGVEGAVVISGRARNPKDAGRATVISYLCVLLIYIMISALSMGVMTRGQLAQLGNPPLADVMCQVVGPWGGNLINAGVILSLLGATLGHTIISAECAYEAAAKGSFCRIFTAAGRSGSPAAALIITGALIQLFLIIVYKSASTYQIFYTISTTMMVIPYLLTALYYWQLTGERIKTPAGGRMAAGAGVLYGLWLIYSGGPEALMTSALLYAPGTLIYIKGKREQNQLPFLRMRDKVLLTLVLSLFVVSLALLRAGLLAPF